MYKTKFCLGLSSSFSLPYEQQIRTLRQIGFEGFFTGWSREADIACYRRIAKEEGLLYQSIHAPYTRMNLLWEPSEETADMLAELIECLRACAENDVPLMVAHPYIGFERHDPTPEGAARFEPVVREAQRLGVKIALENTEGQEYLATLMAHFRGEKAVGFCWDSGHEMCYNRSEDMLALYGDRLLGTHLNDNLGVRDYTGKITYLDDLHLLPFDGAANWEDNMCRLNRAHFDGPLTFELTTLSKRGRHENDAYAHMDSVEYLTLAYARACRLAMLRQRLLTNSGE